MSRSLDWRCNLGIQITINGESACLQEIEWVVCGGEEEERKKRGRRVGGKKKKKKKRKGRKISRKEEKEGKEGKEGKTRESAGKVAAGANDTTMKRQVRR